jgi:uncharacterized protein (DUF2236 family)
VKQSPDPRVLVGHAAPPTPGFHRNSSIRQVGGEPVMFLGAQRALLLQIAHPLVAAAVNDHSTFRRLPVRRLWATADAMLLIVWGEGDEPLLAHGRVMAIHDRIHGSLPEDVGSHPRATAYDAHDARLVRWVWATLVDTMVTVHVRWLGPLDHAARQTLLDDWCRFGAFFGLAIEDLPSDWRSFKGWFRAECEHLAVGPAGREVAAAVLDPPLWFVPRAVKEAYALIATGLLPPELRAAYGVDWSEEDEAVLEELDDAIRAVWSVAPPWRRELPYAYLAARRIVAPRIERLARRVRRGALRST